jgi:hypothetical protein
MEVDNDGDYPLSRQGWIFSSLAAEADKNYPELQSWDSPRPGRP